MNGQIWSTPNHHAYSTLGQALGRKDLTLVRNVRTGQLALLQTIANPGLWLDRLLGSNNPALPNILESWTEAGQLMLLLERVEGQSLNEVGTSLNPQQEASLRSLGLAVSPDRANREAICLTPNGRVRLRCLPGRQAKSRLQTAPKGQVGLGKLFGSVGMAAWKCLSGKG